MTQQEKEWFSKLYEVKSNLVRAHDDAKDPIEQWFADENDLYSDTAHFVYELLQNADDAGSSEARFVLYDDKLVFAHHGEQTKRFTISSFETKEQDIGTDRYGSVNALTDRNGTTKTEDNRNGNAIGKFGRGFKSVYGYTKTPRIYDENLRFKLERVIIPVDLSDQQDFPDRLPGETLFVLPFDRDELPSQDAVEQILKKFKELVLPTLFLRNLSSVSFSYRTQLDGFYKKEIDVFRNEALDGVRGEYVTMTFQCNDKTDPQNKVISRSKDELIVFSRALPDGYGVSVGYFRDGKNGPLLKDPCSRPAFCYFPTKHETGFRFLIQAPFRLTATRERIKDEIAEPHNGEMVRALASLAANSIEYLRDIRDQNGRSLVDDDIIDIIPTTQTTKADYKDRLDLSPFAAEMRRKFESACVIPTKSGGHVKSNNAYWPESKEISELFSKGQLGSLFGNTDAEWVFATRWADQDMDKRRLDFITNVVGVKCSPKTLIEKIDYNFVNEQSVEWLVQLHEWIVRDNKRQDSRLVLAKTRPIFKNQCGHPVAGCSTNGDPQLFLPGASVCIESRKERTVHEEFVKAPASLMLLNCYGISEPKLVDDVNALVTEDWEAANTQEDHLAIFQKVFENINKLGVGERAQIIKLLKDKKFLAIDSSNKKGMHRCRELYFRTNECEGFFKDRWYLEKEEYLKRVNGQEDKFADFMRELGVTDLPRLVDCTLRSTDFPQEYLAQNHQQWGSPSAKWKNSQKWEEPELDGLKDLLEEQLKCEDEIERSRLFRGIWQVLEKLSSYHASKGETWERIKELIFPQGCHKYFNRHELQDKFDNLLLYKLRTSKWLPTCSGEFRSPTEISTRDINFPDGGGDNSLGRKTLQLILGIEQDAYAEVLDKLRKSDPELAEKVERTLKGKAAVGEAVKKGSQQNRNGRNIAEEEKLLELDPNVRGSLEELFWGQPPQEGAVDALEKRDAKVVHVPDLLQLNLRIPNYQRPYKWDKQNVWDMLDDVLRAGGQAYRMGTIILHREEDAAGKCVYKIVDGQQRTLTFILLATVLGMKCRLLNNIDFYPSLSQSPDSRRNLHNNLVHICDYIKMHGERSRELLIQALENHLEVVVICVDNQDAAFQLFDSQNARGRQLEPHDLLKAYHLRELDWAVREHPECYKEKDPRMDLVGQWEAQKIGDLSYLFDKLLYPIMKWSRREKCYGFTTKDLKAFKGVPQRWEGKYGYVDNAFACMGKFRIGSEFAPGEEFFRMVSHYQLLRAQVLAKAAKIPEVKAVMESPINNTYTRSLFEAVLLCYFDRFGLGLIDEETNAAIRVLCRWVYAARLDLDYFSPKTPNKYALGVVDGSVKYTNRLALFKTISESIFHTDVAKLGITMSARRRDDLPSEDKKKLWDAVNAL